MGNQLVVEQLVPAPPARVYAAFNSADALARWWWPHIPDTTYEIDARVGGRYEIRSEAAGIGARGAFLELDEPNLIRMTWVWLTDGAGEDLGDRVTVSFIRGEGGTRVVLTHDLPEAAGQGDDIRQGWVDVLARLPGVVA